MHKNKYFPLLLITPFIIFFVLFRLLPILFTAITSVVDFNNADMNLVFFDNIKSMINDNIFWKSIINTLLIFIFYIIIKFLFIFFIANLLEDVRRKRLVLLFLYLPTLVGLFAYAIIFKYVFTYQGVINNFIEMIFGFRIDWFGSSLGSRIMISIATLWGSAGFYVLIYINALKNIPKSYEEVLILNGGNTIDRLRFVQIPLTLPVLKTIVFLSVVEMIALIEIPMNLTLGNPNQSTITLSYYVYIQAIQYGNFSYAAMLGLVIMIIGFIFYFVRKPKGEFIYEVN